MVRDGLHVGSFETDVQRYISILCVVEMNARDWTFVLNTIDSDNDGLLEANVFSAHGECISPFFSQYAYCSFSRCAAIELLACLLAC